MFSNSRNLEPSGKNQRKTFNDIEPSGKNQRKTFNDIEQPFSYQSIANRMPNNPNTLDKTAEPKKEHIKIQVNESHSVECVVCMDSDITTAIVPCGHRAICDDCALKVQLKFKECPICKGPIESTLKVYNV